MTYPTTTLAAIVARTLEHNKVATPGPWRDAKRHAGWKDNPVSNIVGGDGSDVYAGPSSFNALRRHEDAQFIVDARTDAPAMARALAALLPLYEAVGELPVAMLKRIGLYAAARDASSALATLEKP